MDSSPTIIYQDVSGESQSATSTIKALLELQQTTGKFVSVLLLVAGLGFTQLAFLLLFISAGQSSEFWSFSPSIWVHWTPDNTAGGERVRLEWRCIWWVLGRGSGEEEKARKRQEKNAGR